MAKHNVLVAGASGYLGGHITAALLSDAGYSTTAVVRSPEKLRTALEKQGASCASLKVVTAEVTQAASLSGCCEGIDTVISSVGITRQKDGLSHMDVDYQANVNLLEEAKKCGVKKFIYISNFEGERLRKEARIDIIEAKEAFVDVLKQSGLEYCVVRPNGFFSDMAEFYNMAKAGRVYLFGDGKLRLNPIHGVDLAAECVKMINSSVPELDIGGPDVLSHEEIAKLAFSAAGRPVKITRIPNWVRKALLKTLWIVMSKSSFAPVQFFLHTMGRDFVSPQFGTHTLQSFFEELAAEEKTPSKEGNK